MKSVTFFFIYLLFFSINAIAQNEFLPMKNYEFDATTIAAKGYKTVMARTATNNYSMWTDLEDACLFNFNEKGQVISFEKQDDYIYAYQMNDTEEFIKADLTYRNGNIVSGSYLDKQSTLHNFVNQYDDKYRFSGQKRTEEKDPSDYSISEFTYDETGRVIELKTRNYFDGGRRPIGTYVFGYIYEDEQITWVSYKNKKKKKIDEKVEYYYKNNQLLLRKVYKDFDYGDKIGVELEKTYTYSYDQYGRLLEMKKEPSAKCFEEKYEDHDIDTYTYEYKDNSRLVEKVVISTNRDGDEFKRMVVYEYSKY